MLLDNFTGIKIPKLLVPASMVYLTLMIVCTVLLHKTIQILNYDTTAAALLTPLWFIGGDIITEVYGFKVARQMLWVGIFCQFLFTILCVLFIEIKSPASWKHENDYNFVFNGLLRFDFSVLIGTLVSGYLNISLLSKWKFLLKGKYFWLRSIGSSGIGEVLYTFMVSYFVFYGTMSLDELISFTIFSLVFK